MNRFILSVLALSIAALAGCASETGEDASDDSASLEKAAPRAVTPKADPNPVPWYEPFVVIKPVVTDVSDTPTKPGTGPKSEDGK